MRWLMWLAVEQGTGVRAKLASYLIGGKTGTAEKARPGRLQGPQARCSHPSSACSRSRTAVPRVRLARRAARRRGHRTASATAAGRPHPGRGRDRRSDRAAARRVPDPAGDRAGDARPAWSAPARRAARVRGHQGDERLAALVSMTGSAGGSGETEVTGSRLLARGAPGRPVRRPAGTRADGSRFVADALAGVPWPCSATRRLLEEPRVPTPGRRGARAVRWPGRGPLLRSAAADRWSAVTGTSGKTSIAVFTRQLWAGLGHPAASIGTLGVQTRRARRGQPHHPRPDRAAPGGGPARGRRRRAPGDRGLEPRARPAPRGRARDRGGRVHQHQPRPLRLPRQPRRPTTPPSGGCSASCSRPGGRGAERRRPSSPTSPGWPPTAASSSSTTGRQARGLRLLRRAPAADGQEIELEVLGRRHAFASRLVGAFQAHNLLAATGLALGTGGDVDAVLPLLGAVRAPPAGCSSRRSTGAVLRPSWTTPTSPRRWPRRWRRCARIPRAGSSSCSAAVATGTPASGRSWARSRPGSRTGSIVTDDNPRRRTRRRSAGRSWPRPRVRSRSATGRRRSGRVRRASGRRHAARRRQGPRDLPDRGRPHAAVRRCRGAAPWPRRERGAA